MSSPQAPDPARSTTAVSSYRQKVIRRLIWVLFVAFSLIRSPIPAVNEPHYLGKAKHWWTPEWCPGDFFLDSSNPHLIFYVLVGWLTRFFTLEQTASIARVVALGLVAWGWMALTRQLFRSAWTSLSSAAVFTLLLAIGNYSGEWLIGGIESKVFAYACALWGGAMWLRGRTILAALLTAGAVAFHVVVGMWVALAVVLVWLEPTLRRWLTPASLKGSFAAPASETSSATTSHRPNLPLTALVLICGTALALIPALPLVFGGDPTIAREAERVLLTQRVGHHTDPMLFGTRSNWSGTIQVLVWSVLCIVTVILKRNTPHLMRVQKFVAASLLFAAVGLFIGWLPAFSSLDPDAVWRVWLLKFYPFRLADLAVPFGIALFVANLFSPRTDHVHADQESNDSHPSLATIALTVVSIVGTFWLPAPDANSSSMSPEHRREWIQLCTWLRHETPPDALIGSANEDWAIKWFADRPEYVNFKDCPQDAAGVLEWRDRRAALIRWSRASKQDGSISATDLQNLHEITGIDYLIVSRYGPIEIEPIHTQGPFKVYHLTASPTE